MFSLASELPGQPSEDRHGIGPLSRPTRLPQLLPLGEYFVDLSPSEDGKHPCFHRATAEELVCRVFELKEFTARAHLHLADCEGVCHPRDVCSLEDKVFLIGSKTHGDLHNFLKKKKRLPEMHAAQLFSQIVALVGAAHRKNIALRDLKLKKFVFEDPQRTILKLQNLEDAQFLDHGGQLTERHGCPAYVCPEMLQPGSYSGKAADMWSLGIILYTLLVGHYPFFDTNPQTLFSKIRSGFYHIPDHVSYLARTLISSLLSYEPHNRVSAEAMLEHPWFHRTVEEPPLPLSPTLDQTVPTDKLC